MEESECLSANTDHNVCCTVVEGKVGSTEGEKGGEEKIKPVYGGTKEEEEEKYTITSQRKRETTLLFLKRACQSSQLQNTCSRDGMG